MNRRRADGGPCGCRHPARKAGGAGGSEEIGDGVGAGTGTKVDGIGVVAGVVIGVGPATVREGHNSSWRALAIRPSCHVATLSALLRYSSD